MDSGEILLGFSIVLCFYIVSGNELARGWGNDIQWVTFEDGQRQARVLNKPLMLLIHKSWCGACKSLKPKFAESPEILEASTDLIMVNVVDDEEPKDIMYAPDGAYIPRILFLNSKGERMVDIFNEDGHDGYRYYYPQPGEIHNSMKRAIERHHSLPNKDTEDPVVHDGSEL